MNRSRGFVFTWNNPPPEFKESLDRLNCRYIVVGLEHAPTTDTVHGQGFVYFTHAKSYRAVHALLPGCHVEASRGTPAQCDTYCRKEDPDPYCRGELPLSNADKGAKEKARWEEVWNLAKRGDIESIAPDIRIRLYSSLRRIERDFMPAVARLAAPCGLWIRGLAGSGKTRAVLDRYPDAYPKPRSKWWDGYQGEPVVYCDDVSIFHRALGDELKLWSDAYPFIGEIKGGSRKIRPTKFIVTSQYSIEEIWEDEETKAALLRRFVVVEKMIGQNIII